MKRYLFQIVGAGVAVVFLVAGIFKSTNSTASIGFLFIPVAAVFGAFAGDAVKYILDLLMKKRSHSIGKTALILVVFGFCAYKSIQTRMHDEDVRLARNPSTPAGELARLLQKNDSEITREVVSNPSLPQESLNAIIKEHLTDYYVASGALEHPGLSVAEMERIVALERSDFNGDAEYEVYQTYVWAKLVKRKDLPEVLIHKLAAKKNPQYFLILALLESPFVSCEEKKSFLPQTNRVLEEAVHRSMEAQKCL